MSSVDNYANVRRHLGHELSCVGYGPKDEQGDHVNVAIECDTCSEVLVDYDKEELRRGLNEEYDIEIRCKHGVLVQYDDCLNCDKEEADKEVAKDFIANHEARL